MIPPFGLPELAGWTTDETKMPRDQLLQEGTWHAISEHFTVDHVLPRSVYLASKEFGRWLYLAAPDTTTTGIQGITINGVRVLVRLSSIYLPCIPPFQQDPDLGLDEFDACSRLKSFKSLLYDNTKQNDAILTVSLYNKGLVSNEATTTYTIVCSL